jgi:N-acetylated-alpha-linked acidic dipeptidase
MRDEVPTFHGLSVSGNVTGKIVFAGMCDKRSDIRGLSLTHPFFTGYGSKRDFEALEARGFDLRKEPTIVLVKYGKVFRGLKVKAAQEAGAIGCLIYSDPGDDGEKTIKNGYKPYPEGPARQPSSVQRGSVQFLSSYPGDPSTPGCKPFSFGCTEMYQCSQTL